MKVSIIAAMGTNYAIGKDNDLVWDLPDDMKFFKEKTKGHVVIMGRKNYESIPAKWRPLPNRTNIILTTQQSLSYDGAIVMSELTEALEFAENQGEEEAFIIGGGQIYKMGIPLADRMYLTEINADFDADVFFPDFKKEDWIEVERKSHPKDEKHAYSFEFVVYDRK